MEMMKKITISSFRKNKKRTIVTIIGIMLATALITTVATMGESLRASMIAYEKRSGDDYHHRFFSVSGEYVKYFKENHSIESATCMGDIGYGLLEGSQNEYKPYVFIRAIGAEKTSLELVEGRMAKTPDELVISEHILNNGLVNLKVGDEITFQMGERVLNGRLCDQDNLYHEEEEFRRTGKKTYRIVGIVKRPSFRLEAYSAPGYSVFTFEDDFSGYDSVDINVRYKKSALRKRNQVAAGILGVSEESVQDYLYGSLSTIPSDELEKIEQITEGIGVNSRLISLELLQFHDRLMTMLYSMVSLAILIIVGTSIFCIRNSFMISLMEKTRLYGMITSIGATRKQRKKMVYLEARYLSFIGIPLGILLGILASFITTKGLAVILTSLIGDALIFQISYPAILIAIVVSICTVYLSAARSARVASKYTPVEAIKGTGKEETFLGKRGMKRKARTYRVPKLIDGLFGIGGKLAYKNLRRSKVKYRTTVLSIIVSVAAFIGLTTFTEEVNRLTMSYYQEDGYQLQVTLEDELEKNEQMAGEIAKLPGITFIEIAKGIYDFRVPFSNGQISDEYINIIRKEPYEIPDALGVTIFSLGDQAYEKYCKDVGISVEQAKDQAILINSKKAYYYDYDEQKMVTVACEKLAVKPGDELYGIAYDYEAVQSEDNGEVSEEVYAEEEWRIPIVAVTDVRPLRLSAYADELALIVSDEWMDGHRDYIYNMISVKLLCEDAYALEKEITDTMREQKEVHYSIYNVEEEYQQLRALYLAIQILLYGFIIVIALIGITNIVNTITTNMELRSREFAMLRSVGMTIGEFKRMLLLENIFYGGKALLFALPIGCGFSYLFYQIMSGENKTQAFQLPWKGMGLSVLAVSLLLWVLMLYSMKKNAERNIIETIMNENI